MAPRWRPRHTMYLAASLSAWGDRMWTFAVGLYMVYATPDSLRLTAIYGLVISVSVIALGATVGRWVDTTDRLRAAQLSLLVQNSAVCCCAVLLIVGLQHADYAASTWRGWLQIALQVLVILIADVAALATEANKITIEKDWVVVMARGDQDALAWMNSAFRTIDLGTFILAPVLVGQLMTFLSPVAAAGFMAGWNVISLAVEYSLLRVVYRSVPQLSHPKQADPGDDDDGRPSTAGTATTAGMGSGNKVAELQPLGGGQLPMEVPASLEPRASVEVPAAVDMEVPAVELNGAVDAATADGQTPSQTELPGTSSADGSVVAVAPVTSVSPTAVSPPPKPAGCCHWLSKRLSDMKRGWTVYFRSDFCLAGLALASLYMTVLGFDNITAGYGYTQGLSESTLSLLTGAGAFAGICGSLTFPKLRHTVGPTRAGIVGFSLAVLAQSLSLASVFLPGTAFWPLADPDQQSRTSVITLFCGIILARFGLWISDLSVTQLLQERVPESRRGAVSGVQSSLNMTMDTAKCLLVVAVPRASHFGLLIILSYLFWIIGWCFFLAYSVTAGRRPSPVLPESGSLTAANATTSAGNVVTPAAAVGPKTELAVPHEVQPLLDSNGAAAVAAPNGHSPALDGGPDPPPAVVAVVDGDRDGEGSALPAAANDSPRGDGSPRAELKV